MVILAWRIVRLLPQFVLLKANSESHALLRFLPHWLLHLAGMVYLRNFLDPLRGPKRGLGRRTHAVSSRIAYASLSGRLIHRPPTPRAFLPPSPAQSR